MTMVAIDKDGNPTPVPPLKVETPDEIRRHRQAEERMQARCQQRKREKGELAE